MLEFSDEEFWADFEKQPELIRLLNEKPTRKNQTRAKEIVGKPK